MGAKQLIKDNFQYFFYFYRYLRYRIFVAFGLSFTKGMLDGFGLAMFIPLLKMSSEEPVADAGSDELGNLSFLPETLESFGINLTLVNVLLIILFFFCMKGVVAFVEGYAQVVYQQRFMREIRISNINLLNSYNFRSFVKSDVGKIQNTFSGEVERVNVAYRSYFKSIEYGVLVLVYVLMAFSANAKFALIVAVGGVMSNLLFKWLFAKTKQLSKKYTVSAHSFQGLLIQLVSTYKYLKATGRNKFYGEKLKGNITSLEYLQRNIGIVDSLLRALREPVTIFVVVVGILVQITYFNPEIGLIILSLLFLYRSLTFLMALQEQWNRFLGVSGSLENMNSFTAELKSDKERNGKLAFGQFQNKIQLDNVHFQYDNAVVLNGIDLEINKYETIAIVGESGSGKSTLMNLLSGLLLPSQGRMLIDGVDIREIDQYSFRTRIGYIAQEAPIFNDTIFNNVTFWAQKTPQTMKRFQKAIRKAAIEDFVNQLPFKEDEYLGNNGINISGGQKQRLSIAREMYKNVDFLFMDEATSALDGETEKEIQTNMDELRGEYTIVMIAHRLATIKNADRIVLLRHGKIEAIGSFHELVATSARFEEMVRLQGMAPERINN